jgi:hypothetical protein
MRTCRRQPETPRDLIAEAKGISVVLLCLERILDIIRDLVLESTMSMGALSPIFLQKQDLWSTEPQDVEWLTTPRDEECLTRHPIRLLTGV